MELLKACCLLIGAGEGAELCVLIVAGEEGDADGSAGASDLVVVAGVGGGRRGRVVAAEAVGDDAGGVSGEVGDDELLGVGGGDDDVGLLEELRHFADGEGAGAIGLDVFDGGIEAGDAEELGQSSGLCAVRSLSRPVGVSASKAAAASAVRRAAMASVGKLGQFEGDEVDAHGFELVEGGEVVLAVVGAAGAVGGGFLLSVLALLAVLGGLVGRGGFFGLAEAGRGRSWL